MSGCIDAEFSPAELALLEEVRQAHGLATQRDAAEWLLRRQLREGIDKMAARRTRLRIVKGGRS